MTSTTTDSGGRVVEHVDGMVVASNERGVKLAGRAEYINFSRYANPPIHPPRRGAHVSLGLDADGYARDVHVVDAPTVDMPGHSEPDRSRDIRRQVAMKCAARLVAAAMQAREAAQVEHVFPLADRILAWLDQP